MKSIRSFIGFKKKPGPSNASPPDDDGPVGCGTNTFFRVREGRRRGSFVVHEDEEEAVDPRTRHEVVQIQERLRGMDPVWLPPQYAALPATPMAVAEAGEGMQRVEAILSGSESTSEDDKRDRRRRNRLSWKGLRGRLFVPSLPTVVDNSAEESSLSPLSPPLSLKSSSPPSFPPLSLTPPSLPPLSLPPLSLTPPLLSSSIPCTPESTPAELPPPAPQRLLSLPSPILRTFPAGQTGSCSPRTPNRVRFAAGTKEWVAPPPLSVTSPSSSTPTRKFSIHRKRGPRNLVPKSSTLKIVSASAPPPTPSPLAQVPAGLKIIPRTDSLSNTSSSKDSNSTRSSSISNPHATPLTDSVLSIGRVTRDGSFVVDVPSSQSPGSSRRITRTATDPGYCSLEGSSSGLPDIIIRPIPRSRNTPLSFTAAVEKCHSRSKVVQALPPVPELSLLLPLPSSSSSASTSGPSVTQQQPRQQQQQDHQVWPAAPSRVPSERIVLKSRKGKEVRRQSDDEYDRFGGRKESTF